MHLILLALVLVSLSGCQAPSPPTVPDDWQTIKAGDAFTFQAPPDVQPEEVQGIDSFVGKYVSPTVKLGFDYGWYSDPMDRDGYTRTSTTIDGRRAYLVTKDDMMGVHFPKVEGEAKLTMHATLDGADPETVESIFRTIDFPD